MGRAWDSRGGTAGSRPSAHGETARHLLALAVVLLTAAYLGWRLSTFNPQAPFLSAAFYGLEWASLLGLGLFLFATWDPRPVPHRRDPTPIGATAVLVPTVSEPAAVLLPTVAAATRIRGADHVVVIDSGRRQWVEDMAAELGAAYVPFDTGAGGKGGALNHAIARFRPAFVLTLDADHVASPEILERLLPYFADPDVAVVQTPQDFYNERSFEHSGAGYCEESLFYRVMQPAKDHWNASFWCGTGAVLRTAALASVGGVATDTLTEDIHTTLRLHRHGWRTVYHDEVLARGVAATDAVQYSGQRLRWGRGAMQVLRRERPFLRRGLRPTQQLAYASSILGWFEAWRTLGYLLLPILVVVTLRAPLDAPARVFVPAFATVFLLQQLTLRVMGRGHARLLRGTVFDVARMQASLLASLQLLWDRRDRPFVVTRKGAARARRRVQPPGLVLALLGATTAAVALHVARELSGALVELAWPTRMAFMWMLVNAAVLIAGSMRISARRHMTDRRAGMRFPVELRGRVGDVPVQAVSLSLGGVRLHGALDPPRTEERGLLLELPQGPVELQLRSLERLPDAWHATFVPGQWAALAAVAAALPFAPASVQPDLLEVAT